MKHKKYGGRFVKIQTEVGIKIYQCNKCGAVISVYKKRKTATSGNPPSVVKRRLKNEQ